ncbi:MAG TPA: SBBP repeat-containing protein [Pyrinomonadaceae bacterium]|nr:SBBP repeat-containing protein [Pyrinomonadaceae bacterium]
MSKKYSKTTFFGTLAVLSSLIFSLSVPAKVNLSATELPLQNQTEINSDNLKVQKDYGKTSLLFEENKGQTDKSAKFVSRGKGYTLYLTESEAVFSLKAKTSEENDENFLNNPKTEDQKPKTVSENLTMQFVGANKNPNISGEAETVTKTNYYIGKKRFENLSNYKRVNYKNIYDGIDAVFYGNENGQLEYDFIVAPNADTNKINLNFDGAKDLLIDENGNLVVKTENAELTQQKPFAYQIIDGEKREVEANYVKCNQSQIANCKSQISFALGEYDRNLPLIIDPKVDYLTYIGGTAFDDTFEVAADVQGNAYFTGKTESLNFHGEIRDGNDAGGAYIAKLNAQGTDFLYVTILEGNGEDTARGIAVDASGNAFVTGVASHFFPTTSGAYDTTHGVANSADAFAAKLNTSGTLVYSTFLGGTDLDEAFDVAIDAGGKAYVVGFTYSNVAFPTKNKYQGCGIPLTPGGTFDSQDAFLTVLNAAGSDITYSSCIGNTLGIVGASDETAFSVAVDSANNAYVTGITNSNSFKVKNAFQPNIGGGKDGWVAKFNPAASGDASVVYATFLGGSGTDQGNGIAVNSSGQAHVVGLTGSTNFPLLNPFRSTNQINEGFVTILNASGNGLVNSSFLGGSDQDVANNVALDATGSIYVTGNTTSSNFPTALPFQAARAGVKDAFVSKIKFGRGVISSSFLGGTGNDNGDGIAVSGNFIYVTGDTASTNLATTNGVVKQTTNNADGFVAKILDTRLESVGVFRPATTFSLTQSITNVVAQNATFTSGLSGARGVSGDFDGDGIDTIGSFTNGTWKIRNVNFPLVNIFPPITINFGQAGDLPVVGDWDGDGIDTLAVFRPSAGQFFATNSLAANPPVDFTVTFGQNGDLPVAGDWNADGVDTVGVYRPSAGTFFLTNTNDFNASVDVTAIFGVAEDLPFAGDFNGDGIDTISVFRPSVNTFFITNDNAGLATAFPFGQPTDQPIVGDWDGKPLP